MVTGGDVVRDRETRDAVERVCDLDVATATADDDRELALVIGLRDMGRDDDRLVGRRSPTAATS